MSHANHPNKDDGDHPKPPTPIAPVEADPVPSSAMLSSPSLEATVHIESTTDSLNRRRSTNQEALEIEAMTLDSFNPFPAAEQPISVPYDGMERKCVHVRPTTPCAASKKAKRDDIHQPLKRPKRAATDVSKGRLPQRQLHNEIKQDALCASFLSPAFEAEGWDDSVFREPESSTTWHDSAHRQPSSYTSRVEHPMFQRENDPNWKIELLTRQNQQSRTHMQHQVPLPMYHTPRAFTNHGFLQCHELDQNQAYSSRFDAKRCVGFEGDYTISSMDGIVDHCVYPSGRYDRGKHVGETLPMNPFAPDSAVPLEVVTKAARVSPTNEIASRHSNATVPFDGTKVYILTQTFHFPDVRKQTNDSEDCTTESAICGVYLTRCEAQNWLARKEGEIVVRVTHNKHGTEILHVEEEGEDAVRSSMQIHEVMVGMPPIE